MNKIETISAPHPVAVDVASIQKELTSLWKEAAGSGETGMAPVTRARLLNLIVWSEGPPGDPALARTLNRVVAAHPARVILLEIDSADRQEKLQAWISARCSVVPSGDRQVCCEQITIRASGSSVRHLPGLSVALTASDLPVAFLAAGPPQVEEASFHRLAEFADRLLIDSASLRPEGLGRLAALASALKRTTLGDLNWRRLRPWQEMVAGFFDGPLCLPFLPAIDRIEAAGGAGAETSARLLTGWAGSALGGRRIEFDFTGSGRAQADQLVRIRLEARGDRRAAFVVEAELQRGCFSSRVEMDGTCPLPRRLKPGPLERWQLICGQLERGGRDRLYEAALAHAAALP